MVTKEKYELITDRGDGFYSWNGNLYHSDIVRSCIRPKAQAIGKAVGKHIRESIDADGKKSIKVNPDLYMKFLLEEPNPFMTGQVMQEKLGVQLELNSNAFAYVDRDENDIPIGIYPITGTTTEALYDTNNELYIRFTLMSGHTVTFKYTDLIHIRKDFSNNEIFGDSPASSLTPLMEIVNTSDQGIVKAIKHSSVIRWLLKFKQSMRPEDIKKQTQDFVKNYLDTESETIGAAAQDSKFDAEQVEPKDFVMNASQMDRTTERIYSFFNTNKNIVQSSYNEDQWISYYENCISPVIEQLSNEYTRKLFNRRERGFGNYIIFESSNLTFASMQTKLNLVQFVDRGIMVPNEVRHELHLAPIDGGDTPIRRLDTRPTTE